MSLAFRMVYLIALSGLVVVWVLDLDLASIVRRSPPALETVAGTDANAAFDPTGLRAQIAALDAKVAEIGGRPMPEPTTAFDPAGLQAKIVALEAEVAEIGAREMPKPIPAFDPAGLQVQIGRASCRERV